MRRTVQKAACIAVIGFIYCLGTLGANLSHALSVKEFGAKGDGMADDSDAIQKAVNKVAELAKVYPRPWGAGFPELVFPEGEYRISKTIVLGSGLIPGGGLEKGRPTNNAFSRGMGFAYVRGEGKAVIRQDDPGADIFYVGVAYRTVIEKLSFEGGRCAINLWTGNQDLCMPIIRDCSFSGSSSYAIQTPYIKKLENGDFVGYMKPGPDGKMADVDDPLAKHFLYHSTYLHIQRCQFKRCANILFTVADMALMEDCEIETSPDMKGAAIKTGGMLKLERIDGLANVKEGNAQRWIDLDFGTQTWIIAQKLKLKGANGKGLCVVYGNDKFRLSTTINPHSLVIQDSEFDCSGCPEGAAVLLNEVPNIVSLSNCVQTGAQPVKAIALAQEKDSAYFKQVLKPGGFPIIPSALAFMADDANKGMDCELPGALEPYRRKPLPESAKAQIDAISLSDKDAFLSASSFKPSKRIDAASFGLLGDGVNDDSAAIQRALDAAGKETGLVQIDFPGSVCKISSILQVPESAVLRGAGRIVFLAADGAEAGFEAKSAKELAFLNCAFESGAKALSAKIKKGVDAKILFDNCSFSNTSGPAVEVQAFDSNAQARLRSKLRIASGAFFNAKQAAVSNVSATIDSCWISTYFMTFKTGENLKSKRSWEGAKFKGSLQEGDPTRDIAVIENRGRLYADGVCGVPCAQWLRKDLRWIDSHGELLCDFFRFGGEGGGLTALKTFQAEPGMRSIDAIQNSWTHHGAGSWNHPGDKEAQIPQTRIVECASAPEALILRGNVGTERSYPPNCHIGESVQAFDAKTLEELKKRLFMSCNVIPEDAGIVKTQEEVQRAAALLPGGAK